LPELPDVTVYCEGLEAALLGQQLRAIRLASPFVLRSVEPAPTALADRELQSVRRLGKRIVLGFPEEHYLVIHLMIAGRLKWRPPRAPIPKKLRLLALDWDPGTVLLTEASPKKRAGVHVVRGADALRAHDPGGLEILESDGRAFAARLSLRNHTLKRALTDPTLFSGIGNAYSDEILHRARLSPLLLTQRLDESQVAGLFAACRAVLTLWTDRLRAAASPAREVLPEKVTAFREGMAVHGRHGEPCPDCGRRVQRIRWLENECNYCAVCQNEGRLLADRALSRLLKDDWPRTLDELEDRQARALR
jgi:formamidopyrimidine-DNA glycosylase